MAKAKDLTGQRFGRLAVIELDPEPYRSPTGKPTRRWKCKCDCGNIVTALTNQLTSGQKQSCGCLQREAAAANAKDLTGQRFGKWTVLEKATLPKPDSTGARSGWLCRCDCGTERIVLARSLRSGASRSCGCDTAVKAAKRIDEDNVLGRFSGTVVSAIRPDRPPNKNNLSGVKGVYWNSREQRWIAKIGFRGKQITLGRFKRLEDAAEARRKAEQELFAPVLEEYAQSKNGKEGGPTHAKKD